LTISRELCRLLGGELHIQSEFNQGSSFTIYLPLINDGLHGERTLEPSVRQSTPKKEFTISAPIEAQISQPVLNEMKHQKMNLLSSKTNGYVLPHFIEDDRDSVTPDDKSVLIIEDDSDFSKILMGISQEKQYKVIAAGDGKSALHLAALYQPSAIILDLGLPDLDGVKVLDFLKIDLTTRHIPVHVITGRETGIASMQHGAIGVLNKPASTSAINEVFKVFEHMLNGQAKKLLIIEDDVDHSHSLKLLLENDSIEITEVNTGEGAIDLMRQEKFDCIVLDLGLPDITGHELLRKMQLNASTKLPPVVINTGRELSEQEYTSLSRFTDKIILKGSISNERLLDEVMLFLHQTEASLPEGQRKAIQMLHNDESFFQDKTILLVDDDLRNTFALTTVLEDKGFNVIIAENGLKALEALESNHGIQVVLMDIMMPVMDGYEAMGKIREQEKYKNLPIIALTAKAMAEDRAKCLDAGANDYMNKPVKTDELLALLKVSIT